MGVFIDISGQVYGRLTVISRAPNRHSQTAWFCQCSCGNMREVIGASLKNGNTVSCGCAKRDHLISIATHHGGAHLPEFHIWQQMRSRCSRATHQEYHNYGARGISVCDRWQLFGTFLADMGRRPSDKHSLDRIDNNGNYEPANCRWATAVEQSNNTRRNRWVDLPDGRRMTVSQYADELGVNRGTMWNKLNRQGLIRRAA